MKRSRSNKVLTIGIGLLIAAGAIAQVKKDVLFKDTFDGKGALGSGWETWKNVSSSANPTQKGGCLVFSRSSETLWAQAAVQTAKPVDVSAGKSIQFKFRIKDFGGSGCDAGTGKGTTSFIVAEHDNSLDSLYGASDVEGLVLLVEHSSINFGSWPNPEEDPRTWVEIRKTDDTLLGKMVVQSTNDFTLVMTLAGTWWSLEAEGALFWMVSGLGEASGRHGYDLSTWADGASLRIESWNADGTFPPASINAVSIE